MSRAGRQRSLIGAIAGLALALAFAAPHADAQARRKPGVGARKGVATSENSRAQRATKASGRRAASALHPLVAPSKQAETFGELFRRIEQVAQGGETAVVQVDLDQTSLAPRQRMIAALRRIGEREQIPELIDAASLTELPGYTVEAFSAWKEQSGLAARYPQLRRYGSLDSDDYWDDALLDTDEPTAGLGGFIAAVRRAGGEVVFNSGRWRETMFAPSRRALAKAGAEDIKLYIGNSGYSDAGIKAARQSEIRQRYGRTVAVIDDRIANREAVLEGLDDRDAMSIAIAIPGFSVDPVAAAARWLISTFEVE